VGFDSQGSRDVLPDFAKLRFAGRLGRVPRNADGVRGILEGYLRVPVRVEPFVGEWLPLPEAYHCRLDSGASPRRLGIDAYAGTKTYACQHKFRIVLGPMGFEDYRRLLPGGTSMRRLAAAVRNYIGDELVFDVRLVLAREEVPSAVLGEGARLGWTSWVKNRPRDVDAADLLIRPAEYA